MKSGLRSFLFFLVISLAHNLAFASDDSGNNDDAALAKQGMIYGLGSPYGSPYANPYEQYPYPYDPYYDPYYYPEPTSKKSKSKGFSPLMLILFLFLSQSFQATTTTTTTITMPTTAATIPTTADTCYWGTWQACSATCGGTRNRYRTCSGVQDSQTEDCNHQTYFTSDGWYHASNCFEYSWRDGDWNYDEAVVECSKLGGKLAAVGMREDGIRSEILSKLAAALGVSIPEAWIGVTDSDTPGTYIWTDGEEAEPTFWATAPSNNAENCAHIDIGDPFSLLEADCDDDEGFLCERPA